MRINTENLFIDKNKKWTHYRLETGKGKNKKNKFFVIFLSMFKTLPKRIFFEFILIDIERESKSISVKFSITKTANKSIKDTIKKNQTLRKILECFHVQNKLLSISDEELEKMQRTFSINSDIFQDLLENEKKENP